MTARGERRHLVIHAHFYQPPREDPELDEVEAEASAAPFHDWNERIERECYRAVVAARVHGDDHRIVRIVNTLEWISFNVGPTLFTWMDRHAPDTARRIVAADHASVARLGHGNAIAHPYHHVILPLASRRDKVTEVRWGMADFRRRFGRDPEGMWLPETAVDDETLDVLAQEGIRYTILAPHQVLDAPPNGHAGKYLTANGREIALFPYHGDLSHGIAFGGLVRNADQWLDAIWHVKSARRRTPAHGTAIGEEMPHPLLVSAATDGETYGHHHKFAELALARVLERSRAKGGHVENFASFLARHPATHPVAIVAPSAWSCPHGVERWRSDCGCRMDAQAAPSQAWRTPLREALDALRMKLGQRFEEEGGELLRDPWAARDAYERVLAAGPGEQALAWIGDWLRKDLVDLRTAPARALELLEMSRDALRLFTSCAWFFDDIGGIEPRQVLRYARRAIALSRDERMGQEVDVALAAARSNDTSVGTGADVFRALGARPPVMARIAAAARAMDELGLVASPEGVPDLCDRLPAFSVSLNGPNVIVLDGRLMQGSVFGTSVVSRTTNDISCEVTPLDAERRTPIGPPTVVALKDFPERLRLEVRGAMRDALLARCLTTEELERLAMGAAALKELAAAALGRAVRDLAALEPAVGIERVEVALDLYEQLESNIPFDVQTAFWDYWSGLGESGQDPLRGIARRLGFDGG